MLTHRKGSFLSKYNILGTKKINLVNMGPILPCDTCSILEVTGIFMHQMSPIYVILANREALQCNLKVNALISVYMSW